MAHSAQASQLWNLSLQCRNEHDNRRKEFLKMKKLETGNFDKERITNSPHRRAMRDLANVNRSSSSSISERNPSRCPLPPPSKIRHRLVVEETSMLAPGENLVPFPLCTSPCRVTSSTPQFRAIAANPWTVTPPPSVSRTNATPPAKKSTLYMASQANCSNVKCYFISCPECQNKDHPERPCRITRLGSKVSKSGTMTSKKSKARLRRL